MQNAFYFAIKVLFFSRYLNVCTDFYGHVGKLLDKKAKVKGNHLAHLGA